MREDTRRWVEFADMDLKLAKVALKNKIYIYAAYHAQQAVEKFLKSFLIENNVPYPRTHDIKFLINQCKEIDKHFENLFKIKADKLTFYAIEARYPEAESEVSEEEAKEAVEIAEKVKKFVLEKLKL